MSRGLRVGQDIVYRGTEHPELRGTEGILLAVLSPSSLLVALTLADGRQPVLKVPPRDVGVSEASADGFLHPEHHRV